MLCRVLLSLCLGAVLPGCFLVRLFTPDYDDVFVDMSYPEADPSPTPGNDVTLAIGASLVPGLTVSYQEPDRIGACMAEIAAAADTPEKLFGYGKCVATFKSAPGHDDRERRPHCMAQTLVPWLSTSGSAVAPAAQGSPPAAAGPSPASTVALELAAACPTASGGGSLNPLDEQRLLQALTDAGEAIFSYQLSTRGLAGFDAPMTRALRQAFVNALTHAAAVLALDVARTPAAVARRPFRPQQVGLALSGGAANGAFTAGYIHALLFAREQALMHAAPSLRPTIENAYRFSGASGTSVGSLVSIPLDLYFSDVPTDLSADARTALVGALRACVGAAPDSSVDPGQLMRACALVHLETDLVQNEWDLLCHRDGDIQDLLDRDTSLLQFDPLMSGIVRPFLRDFGELTTRNEFVRVAVATDLQQNVVVGMDERACRLPGMPTQECLSSAILASISEPVFVPSVARVYSGISGPGGERGEWLDGGLRSGTPALIAVDGTRGRVLAVNTSRAEGIPANPTGNALDTIFASVGALVDQGRQWEMAYAQLHRADQRARLCQIGKLVGEPLACPEASAVALPPLQLTGDLMAVFVPENIRPESLAAAGYTFDPRTMRGLFLWGQKTFLESRHKVFDWLGWTQMNALEQVAGYRDAVQAKLDAVNAEVQALIASDTPAERRRHRLARRELLSRELSACR